MVLTEIFFDPNIINTEDEKLIYQLLLSANQDLLGRIISDDELDTGVEGEFIEEDPYNPQNI